MSLLMFCCLSTAAAATRYAAPDGSRASVSCAAANPCTLDRAVNLAAPGDEVIVRTGQAPAAVPA